MGGLFSPPAAALSLNGDKDLRDSGDFFDRLLLRLRRLFFFFFRNDESEDEPDDEDDEDP